MADPAVHVEWQNDGTVTGLAGECILELMFAEIVNMAVTVKGVSFPQPGILLVELLLDNRVVARSPDRATHPDRRSPQPAQPARCGTVS